MNNSEFEVRLRGELKDLGIEVLDIYNRRGYLCFDWRLEPYDSFTSAFRISEKTLANNPEDVIYKIVKDIFLALPFPDNVRGQIKELL